VDPSRQKALEALLLWEKGGSLDLIFQRVVEKEEGLSRKQKAFARELVFGTARWLKRLDWTIERLSQRDPRSLNPVVRNALRIGLYQLCMLDRVPEWAAVNETVELVKTFGKKEASGFVNALLRNFCRKKGQLQIDTDDPVKRATVLWSFKEWLVKRWFRQFGETEAEKLFEALNKVPPFTIRVNTLKVTRERLLSELETYGALPTRFSPVGIVLLYPQGVLESKWFTEGLFQVQDEGAQLVGFLFSPKPGERILDLCAAPGGKTTHFAQMMQNQGEIIAVDVSAERIKFLEENCKRLGIKIVKPLRHDLRTPLPFEPEGFDRVFLDAPCSGLGVIRRNPDLKWRSTPREILRLSNLQMRLLLEASRHVKPGGFLMYSTCTLTPEENQGVVEAFLEREKDFKVIDLKGVFGLESDFFTPEGYFLSLPHLHGTDGFFAALMQKR